MTSPFDDYDALGLAGLVRKGQVSAAELLDEAIARVEACQGTINAVANRCYDYARAQLAAGVPDGPFHGVPFLQKDMAFGWPGAGIPGTNSQVLLKDFVPLEEAHVTRRVKGSGLVLIGTTVAPETGYAASGESILFGDVRNPWDHRLVPGGSSAGAGAAVAARIVPLAGASDSGGSTRFPAAFCGVFGLKASRGRVPVGPPIADIGYGNFVEGCVSISVRDSAAYLDAISGSIPGDPYALPDASMSRDLDRPVTRLRIGMVTAPGGDVPLWAGAAAALEDARKLCESTGHIIEEVPSPLDWMDIFETFDRLMSVGLARQWDAAIAYARRAPRDDEVTAIFREYAAFGRTVTGLEHANDIAALRIASRRIAALYGSYDVVMTPVSPLRTPAIGWASLKTGTRESHLAALGPLLTFTAPANIAGLPAMSVPLYWDDDGLPVGTQFIGRIGAENTLLRLARELEQIAPWAHRRPPGSRREAS